MKPKPPKLDDVDERYRWQTGGEIKKVSVSLRFIGDELNPDEVTSMLKCQPTKAFRKGNTIPDEKYQRTATTGGWILQSSLSDRENIEKHIIALFSSVSNEMHIWQYLTGRYRADLFIGIFMEDWNQGIELSSDLIKQITERHLKLSFDIYCDQGERK